MHVALHTQRSINAKDVCMTSELEVEHVESRCPITTHESISKSLEASVYGRFAHGQPTAQLVEHIRKKKLKENKGNRQHCTQKPLLNNHHPHSTRERAVAARCPTHILSNLSCAHTGLAFVSFSCCCCLWSKLQLCECG